MAKVSGTVHEVLNNGSTPNGVDESTHLVWVPDSSQGEVQADERTVIQTIVLYVEVT